MAQMFYAQDCNLEMLNGKKIAIVGYGSQGHAHALNLKDSGCDVIVALYEGSKSWAKAEAAGLTVMTTADAAKVADMMMILINDEKQADMYHKDIEPNLRPGMILAFAQVDRPAALLQLPYLLWVSFAAVLNFMVWLLN